MLWALVVGRLGACRSIHHRHSTVEELKLQTFVLQTPFSSSRVFEKPYERFMLKVFRPAQLVFLLRTLSSSNSFSVPPMAAATPAKSPAEYKAASLSQLNDLERRVIWDKDTERPGTGEYNHFKPASGYFACKVCQTPLYSAQSKFDSGCGWPAFDKCYEGLVSRLFCANFQGLDGVFFVDLFDSAFLAEIIMHSIFLLLAFSLDFSPSNFLFKSYFILGSIKTHVDTSGGMRRVEIVCGTCGGHLGHVFEGAFPYFISSHQ